MKRIWPTTLLAFILACGGGDAEDVTVILSSDPELARMATDMLPSVLKRSGLQLLEPVRVESRSRQELENYLRYRMDREFPPGELEFVAESYALMGLVPRDIDLRALIVALYTEQAAGFYDPDSTAIFLLDDLSPEERDPVLFHELVHAVQDQEVDLRYLVAPGRGNDQQTAARAAIEGHAILALLEHSLSGTQGEEVDIANLEAFPQLLQDLAPDDSPVLAAAPAILREPLLFPYIHGTSFVQTLWRRKGGRPLPFKDNLPLSTEQVLDPSRLIADEPDVPSIVTIRTQGEEEILYNNTMGQLELGIWIERYFGPGSRELATGWDGDRFLLIRGEESNSLVWAAAWDDEASRDVFIGVMTTELRRFPAPALLTALEADGRPVAVLSIGAAPPVIVRVSEAGGVDEDAYYEWREGPGD